MFVQLNFCLGVWLFLWRLDCWNQTGVYEGRWIRLSRWVIFTGTFHNLLKKWGFHSSAKNARFSTDCFHKRWWNSTAMLKEQNTTVVQKKYLITYRDDYELLEVFESALFSRIFIASIRKKLFSWIHLHRCKNFHWGPDREN